MYFPFDIDIPCISRRTEPVADDDGDDDWSMWDHSSSRSDRSENGQFCIKHSSLPAKVSRGHDPVLTLARMNYDYACALMIAAANLYCNSLQTNQSFAYDGRTL